jgi:hypothetical protein
MKTRYRLCLGIAATLATSSAQAADHQDGSGTALSDPATDITDVYAWMSSDTSASAGSVYLVMDVFPNATSGSLFSTTASYVFHTTSATGILATSGVKRDVVCKFTGTTAPQTASCWVVDPVAVATTEYASGVATSAGAPLTSVSKKLRVYAGPRNDPFFFNLTGFKNATSAVAAALASIPGGTTVVASVDGNGCPALHSTPRNTVLTYLQKDCTGTASAKDSFRAMRSVDNADCAALMAPPALVHTTQTQNEALTGNVLSIVVSVDKSLLTSGGSALGVWGATTH